MNKTKQFLTFAFLLMSLATLGQAPIPKSEEIPYIEVNGTAEKEVVPDEIYISIVIREKYINKVKLTIEEQEGKLKNALKSIGIDVSNLYLSDANADYVKIRWQKKDVLTQNDYTLKVATANVVGQVFLELDKLEIKDAFIEKVNHSNIQNLRKEVKILAIKAAKEKADYLLTAIGEQTGKPLVILENQNFVPLEQLNINAYHSKNIQYSVVGLSSKFEDSNEIQFEKIKIQSSIYVKFAIK
ncbi:MAG: SIMPL domain-containing protein [Cytophagaceae bacterium]|nr:SIMPL domain-containing protein [Cytophagaceae bacterium]